MKLFKKICLLLVVGVGMLSMASCSKGNDSNTITITDCSGAKVDISKNVEKVISVNQSFCAFMTAMKIPNKIIGTHGSVKGHSWAPLFYDGIKDVTRFGYKPTAEAIYEAGADLVVLNDSAYAKSLRDVGIPAIYFGYDNINELYSALDLMGDIFGDSAKKYVSKWKNLMAETVNSITCDLSSLSNSDKKNVYYINAAVNPGDLYTTFGGDSFVEYWINTIGANLVTSSYKDITSLEPETALSLKPDTIIISGYAEYKRKDELLGSELWSDIPAVKNQNIYLMPTSFVSYERFAVELPMLLSYSANLLYPNLHTFNGTNELKEFYENYYGKTFNDVQLNNMLLGLNPDGTRMD